MRLREVLQSGNEHNKLVKQVCRFHANHDRSEIAGAISPTLRGSSVERHDDIAPWEMHKWMTKYVKWHVDAMGTDDGMRLIGSLVQNKDKSATKMTISRYGVKRGSISVAAN